MPQTQTFNTITTNDNVKVWYREAGSKSNPTILLLHGFPTSSYMFRQLIPLLSDKYHLLAPDLPGFGVTEYPEDYVFTFDNIANTISSFVDIYGIKQFAIYVMDYGAPVGFRLAVSRPEQITAIITQNGNGYEEGLSGFWDPLKEFWKTGEGRQEIANAVLTFDATKWQYTCGVPKDVEVEPHVYHLDWYFLQLPGRENIQLDLFYDYRNNVAKYPQFQKYFRDTNVPILAVWGENDEIFPPASANAFKRDSKNVRVELFPTGHFALETHAEEIAASIAKFLA